MKIEENYEPGIRHRHFTNSTSTLGERLDGILGCSFDEITEVNNVWGTRSAAETNEDETKVSPVTTE